MDAYYNDADCHQEHAQCHAPRCCFCSEAAVIRNKQDACLYKQALLSLTNMVMLQQLLMFYGCITFMTCGMRLQPLRRHAQTQPLTSVAHSRHNIQAHMLPAAEQTLKLLHYTENTTANKMNATLMTPEQQHALKAVYVLWQSMYRQPVEFDSGTECQKCCNDHAPPLHTFIQPHLPSASMGWLIV